MKALKELDEERIFKNWGTQTEKEDTSSSKYFYFCFSWVFFGGNGD
jgi:hypothetical protein